MVYVKSPANFELRIKEIFHKTLDFITDKLAMPLMIVHMGLVCCYCLDKFLKDGYINFISLLINGLIMCIIYVGLAPGTVVITEAAVPLGGESSAATVTTLEVAPEAGIEQISPRDSPRSSIKDEDDAMSQHS